MVAERGVGTAGAQEALDVAEDFAPGLGRRPVVPHRLAAGYQPSPADRLPRRGFGQPHIQPGLAGRHRLLPPGTDRGAPVITVADASGDSLPDPCTLRRFASRNPSTRYLVRAGDILFRARGDRPTATVLDSRYREPAVAVLPLFILRPDRSRVAPRYLAWAINRPVSQHHFARVAHGTGTRWSFGAGSSR